MQGPDGRRQNQNHDVDEANVSASINEVPKCVTASHEMVDDAALSSFPVCTFCPIIIISASLMMMTGNGNGLKER